MSDVDVLVRRLGALEPVDLAGLLDRRSDVLLGATARDLNELAQRLWHSQSLVAALRALPLPCLHLIEAAQALGDGCSRAALADFLAGEGPEHRGEVARVVEELATYAVLTDDAEGRISLPEALAEIYPRPLRLGQPLRVLLRDQPVEAMRRILTMLGGAPKQKSRAQTVAALVGYFGDQGSIRALLAGAPDDVAGYLSSLGRGEAGSQRDLYDPNRYGLRQAAIAWAGERGLLIGRQYGYDWQLPAEVARALRGPDYRAPFTPRRPEPAPSPVDPGWVETDSAAAATQFADQVLAVLDQLARAPVPSVKSGGIGTRELAKLAKSTATGDTQARLALELAGAVGLLDYDTAAKVGVSEDFPEWRELAPGDRYGTLLCAWWSLGCTPTEAHDAEGKALRVLARTPHCEGCRAARVSLLEAMAEIDGALEREPVAAIALWRRPLVHLVAQDEDDPFATVWREAELLGVIANGALSELGRLLLAGATDALAKHASGLLPASAELATFGADLTVYVTGAPSARVSRLLDLAADREGRGGAVIWRFSPPSVRRAFDDGTTGVALSAALRDIATAELPQPLRYLIADVARKHGNLRLTSATSCVRGEDPALLAEVAAHRKLTKLGLRLLAPTVLASDAPVEQLLTALRAAGYLPVADDQPGNVVDLSARHRAGSAGTSSGTWARGQVRQVCPEPARADPVALATVLLRRGAGADVAYASAAEHRTPTEQRLSALTRSLSAAEIRQLAHAIDSRCRVRIAYQSSTGATTDRVIDQTELSGGSLFAWCELREDERVFTVARIRSVIPV